MKPKLSITRAKQQQKEFTHIKQKMVIEDTLETARRLCDPAYWLVVIGSLFLLTSCAPAPVETTPPPAEVFETEEVIDFQEETPATEEVIKKQEVVATPTPEATAIPLIEPRPVANQAPDTLPISPPDFNNFKSQENGAFDLVDAHAVYAYYRQKEGPSTWANDGDFVAAMEMYAGQLKDEGIDLEQVAVESQSYTLLVNGNQILLNFEDGELNDADPGRWSEDSTPEWVDAGRPVKLVVGADGHAYIIRIDSEGNATAFLNTIGATLDNLDQQWIEVQDGMPNAVWNGKEWSSQIPIQAVAGHFRPYPEYGGYTFITPEEISTIPTTITVADTRKAEYGVQFKESVGSDYGIWSVGEIVDMRHGSIIGRNGEEFQVLELVIDIPSNSGEITRFYYQYGPEIFRIVYNLDAIQQGTANLKQDGIDIMAGLNLGDIVASTDLNSTIKDGGNQQQRFESLRNRDLVGTQIGVLVPSIAYEATPSQNTGGAEIPNPAIEFLLNDNPDLNPSELYESFFDPWKLALPQSIFE